MFEYARLNQMCKWDLLPAVYTSIFMSQKHPMYGHMKTR
jgi:hypothetical protein